MGHHITALVARGSADYSIAEKFGTAVIELEQGFVLIPLDAWQSDYWAEKLELGYGTHRPIILDNPFAHMLASNVLESNVFAIINTDYNGGWGSQAAVVYSAGEEIMQSERTSVQRVVRRKKNNPINKALRLLGAKRRPRDDEFDTLGIHKHRNFDDLFEAFHTD